MDIDLDTDIEDPAKRRRADAIATAVASVLLVVGIRVLGGTPTVPDTTPLAAAFYRFFIGSPPALLTALVIIGSTAAAGPLGFLGVVLEAVGINRLLAGDPVGGVVLLLAGAALVAVGEPIEWRRRIATTLDSVRGRI